MAISEENLSKLYSGVVAGTELTTKQMNGYGFNYKGITELIVNGYIERVRKGLYSFKAIDKLYNYGKKLIAKSEYDKATLCFEKCFELDSTHLGACFQLFLRSIQKEDYTRAFELYESLSQSDNEYYNIDANYYLYLLSVITDVPEKHKDYARYLKYEDIKIQNTDKRYQDITLQNKVRIAVLQRKFPYAMKQLKDLIAKHGNSTVQDIITRTLLFQAITSENLSKNTVVTLIKERKYEEVVDHLLNKQERHNLSITEEYILKLANNYIEIKESSRIPERVLPQSNTLFEVIDTNNYVSALEMSTEYNAKNNISNNTNAINLLLTDICNLIRSLEKKASTIEEPKEVQLSVIAETVKKSEEPKIQTNISFSSVISFLLKNDLDNAFICLRKYMNFLGKSDYEFLIIDLIKISLLEKDIAFTKPMLALILISKDSYKFDISSYIQEFYITLSQNRFEEARVYLDIISKSNKLGQDCIITDGLYQVLESSEKILNYKRNNEVLMPIEKALEDRQQNEANLTNSARETNNTSSHTIAIEEKKQEPLKKNISVGISAEKRDSEKEFLKARHDELVSKAGIILLRPMDDARIDRIFEMIEEYPDMTAFVIGSGSNQQVVLRYKPIIEEYVDTKNLINIGNQAYNDGNYDECIECYLQLLQIFNEPRAIAYSKLGLSYMKKCNIPLAIDYLTIATDLAKKEKTDLDFSDLISRLKGDIPQKDAKPRFKMSQKDFDYSDVNNFYGIENFDEIDAIVSSSNLDVESTCMQIGMTPEQIDIVKLIYAREFYMQKDFVKGDLFLRSVERSKNKSPKTIKIFNEIKKNKMFYQNRRPQNSRQLVLSLIPQKR